MLTPGQAAALLQVEEADVLALAEEGRLPGRRIGESWRFARAALVRWLAEPDAADSSPAGCGGGRRVPDHGHRQRHARLVLRRRASGSSAPPPIAHGRRLVEEGAAILDVGGESTRPGAEPVTRRGGARARRAGRRRRSRAHGRAAQHRHDEARGRARRRSTPARPTSTTSPRSATTPRWPALVADARLRLLPDAHARRAADDAGRPALRRRRLRGQGVPRGARRVRRRARACARSGSSSTRASASARPSSTTSSCCGASTSSSRSASRSSSASSRKGFLGRLTGREDPHERVPGTVATNVLALERGASRLPRPRRRRDASMRSR